MGWLQWGVVACCILHTACIDNGLGVKVPMGFRTWNAFATQINDKLMREIVDSMTNRSRLVDGKPTSLLDLGYTNVGMDDGWQKCHSGPGGKGFHDASGRPILDLTKFPDMKSTTGYAHSNGIKMGWYMNNCWCKEDKPHYQGDTDAIAEYEFDGVKLDYCGPARNLTLWANLINATGRRVLIENCHWGIDPPTHTWCPFNFFRVASDVGPQFAITMKRAFTATNFADPKGGKPLSRPGCWAYSDMMEISNWVDTNDTALMKVQTKTHFGAWAIVSSPLVLSFDLRDDARMDPAWDTITNRHAIAVSQNWAGGPGHIALRSTGNATGYPAWMGTLPSWVIFIKPQPNKAVAALFVNTDNHPQDVGCWLKDLGLPYDVQGFDIWKKTDMGQVQGGYTAHHLGPHDSHFLLLTPPQ